MTTHDRPEGGTAAGPAVPGPAPGPAAGPRRRARSVLLAAAAVAGLVVIGFLTVAVKDAGTGKGAAGHPPTAAAPFRDPAVGRAGQVSLAAYAGQPVIVNFFASWCAPCQRETPLLARFYAAHHGRIQVIGIDSNDATGPALTFLRAKGVGYPVGADPLPSRTAAAYGVGALPQTFFLNARHQIVRHIEGQVTARELAAWAAQLG